LHRAPQVGQFRLRRKATGVIDDNNVIRLIGPVGKEDVGTQSTNTLTLEQ
jgi:hypothetical protein